MRSVLSVVLRHTLFKLIWLPLIWLLIGGVFLSTPWQFLALSLFLSLIIVVVGILVIVLTHLLLITISEARTHISFSRLPRDIGFGRILSLLCRPLYLTLLWRVLRSLITSFPFVFLSLHLFLLKISISEARSIILLEGNITLVSLSPGWSFLLGTLLTGPWD